ncbi:MAG: MBL fold metallo-hydrolase [Mariniphaga sp.]|nr:MBL fold metallo-hydrolase [Mariniphaga sp.]
MIQVEKFVVNPLQENSFVIFDETGESIFIDPGFYFKEEQQEIKKFIRDYQLSPVLIANTHAHFDHVMGVEFLRKEYNIPFFLHPDDQYWIQHAVLQAEMFGFEMEAIQAPDSYFTEKENVKFGQSELSILHIPGHSKGHVVFYAEQEKILIAGDVLFNGSIGRTDLPGGDFHTLIKGIKNKLFLLPDETRVFCGHGPETVLGVEKNSNPFLI